MSYPRETDLRSWRVSLNSTIPGISPEPEVAAVNHLHLICHHIMGFQASPRLFKSVEPSPRKRCDKGCTCIHLQIYTNTHIHTDISDLDELSRMIYITRGFRGSVQNSGFAAILYPFYRERQNDRKL